jgi:conjugal transfer pilin signal peptidase TrbI
MKPIFIKQLLIAIVFFGGSTIYFKERYYIAIDTQLEPCLYATVFLVDKWDKNFMPGELMVFDFHLNSPVLKQGDDVVKVVAGMPNEEVNYDGQTVSVEGRKTVNTDIREGMDRLGVQFAENSKLELGDGEYFLVGQRPLSFDSRYWGAVKDKQIIGKAYAIY